MKSKKRVQFYTRTDASDKSGEYIQPIDITDKGERVKSKSELTIANALYRSKIPYKYECPIILHNGIKARKNKG